MVIKENNMELKEKLFKKCDDNVARCLKIEPFDVFEIYDREAAFEQAKNDIRVKYKSPYYWACFVMLD